MSILSILDGIILGITICMLISTIFEYIYDKHRQKCKYDEQQSVALISTVRLSKRGEPLASEAADQVQQHHHHQFKDYSTAAGNNTTTTTIIFKQELLEKYILSLKEFYGIILANLSSLQDLSLEHLEITLRKAKTARESLLEKTSIKTSTLLRLDQDIRSTLLKREDLNLKQLIENCMNEKI